MRSPYRIPGMLLGVLFSGLGSSTAVAQVTIAPNVIFDGGDHDLTDGQCDADAVLPGNQCTLRAAFQNAGLIGGNVTIQLGAAAYSLSVIGAGPAGGSLDVDSGLLASLTIQGAGPITVIDAAPLSAGGGPDRVVWIMNSIGAATPVTFRDLAIRGGRGGGLGGGGILCQGGRLVLTNVDVVDCQAQRGGGVRTARDLTTTNGSFAQCVAIANSSGGGLYGESGAILQLSGTDFAGNSATLRGGGLRVESGVQASLSGCDLTGNTAPNSAGISVAGVLDADGSALLMNVATSSGGGLGVEIGGFADLTQCTLRENSAQFGAGINVGGSASLNLTESTVLLNTAGSFGGGIANSGQITVVRSTLNGNRAAGTGGAGIYHGVFSGPISSLLLSTLSGNDAAGGSGGGLASTGSVHIAISSCTIAFNVAGVDGGGVWTDPNGAIAPFVLSTIFASNRLSSGAPRNSGGTPPAPAGPNLDTDGTCMFLDPCLSGSIALPLQAALGPLQANGGPTQTHALLACSPALDAGVCNDVFGNPHGTDQRGLPRGPLCDLGAFEAQPGSLPATFESFCFGTATACPCGLGGAPAHGCPSSVNSQGALLGASGTARVSCDSVVMTGSGMTNSSALLFQGTTQVSGGLGSPFGDGLRCAGGAVIRLGTQLAAAGFAQWPMPAQPPLSAAGGVLPGAVHTYQVWYRNAAAYCTVATFNLTNGMQVRWCP